MAIETIDRIAGNATGRKSRLTLRVESKALVHTERRCARNGDADAVEDLLSKTDYLVFI